MVTQCKLKDSNCCDYSCHMDEFNLSLNNGPSLMTFGNIRLIGVNISSGILPLTLWGLGTWHFTSPRDSALFGDFSFLILNESFICHGSQFSSLFTILQELMSLWPQCNILLCTIKFIMLWMTSQSRHHDVTTEGYICPSCPLIRGGHICPSSPLKVNNCTRVMYNIWMTTLHT